MAFDAGSLMLRIEARDQQLLRSLDGIEDGLNDARRNMDRLEKDAKDGFSAMGRSAALFGVAVNQAWNLATMGLAQLFTLIKSVSVGAVGLASDAGEVGSKFDYVFGDRAEDAKKSLEDFGKTVGRSQLDLKTMASGVQALFTPLGFARDQGAMMSVTLTKLATDLASFNNENDVEVMEGLKSALIGNAEAVRKYGVIISETTLNQELMKMGVKGGTAAASEQQKVIARLNMILEGTKDAQGDATRTADSFANMSKGLWAALSDLGVELGNMLIPSLKVFIGVAKDAVGWIQANSAGMQSWATTLAGWASYVVESVQAGIDIILNWDLYWEMLTLTVEETFTAMADRVKWFADNAWIAIQWFFGNMIDIAVTTANNYLQIWQNVGKNFQVIWANIIKIIRSGGREGFEGLFNAITADMKTFSSSPEFKEFKGTDFSKRWDEHGAKWSERMNKMGTDVEIVGEKMGEELDLGKIFDGLESGGKKVKDLKASISGAEEMFKKNVLGRFNDDDQTKTAKATEATARGVETLVQNNEKNHKEMLDAVKGSQGVTK